VMETREVLKSAALNGLLSDEGPLEVGGEGPRAH